MKVFRLDLRTRRFISSFSFIILATFLIVFPKGGFKIGPIPITWGYLFLGLIAILLVFKRKYKIHSSRLRVFLLTVPFQAFSLATLFANGIGDKGFAISFLITFLFFPFLFFLIFSEAIETLSLELLFRVLRSVLPFIAIYGIVLFLYRIKTGNLIEIPFLTVNFHDLGEMDNKSVDRGNGIFKLISTYNNGNIYGICMLMLLPIYNLCEPRTCRKTIFKLSILLTLSRAVWMGFLLSEVLYVIAIQKEKKWLKLFLLLGSFSTCLLYILIQFEFDFAFLLDRTLGNRIGQIEHFFTADLFSSESFGNIYEMIYMGILKKFGWAGLIFFLMATTGPLWIHNLSSFFRKYNPCEKALRISLLSYLIIAIIEGAILYIPTMVIFWFIASLLQKKDFGYQLPEKFSVSTKPKALKYSRLSLTKTGKDSSIGTKASP